MRLGGRKRNHRITPEAPAKRAHTPILDARLAHPAPSAGSSLQRSQPQRSSPAPPPAPAPHPPRLLSLHPPRRPRATPAIRGLKVGFFSDKNASAGPVLGLIGGLFLIGYTLEYQRACLRLPLLRCTDSLLVVVHLKHHKNNATRRKRRERERCGATPVHLRRPLSPSTHFCSRPSGSHPSVGASQPTPREAAPAPARSSPRRDDRSTTPSTHGAAVHRLSALRCLSPASSH
ncbi:hypothetical protein DFH09DRAFT_1377038 [Mycena vulgaris]|nr:hypothetical protein DFH09DRAFT_1377038 [Mycena vulgaris]